MRAPTATRASIVILAWASATSFNACKNKTTPPLPPDAPAGSYRCKSAKECVVSCHTPGSCCGEPCQCTHAYHRKQLEQLREVNRENCPERPDCPVASCQRPEFDTVPACLEAQCVVAKVPLEAACEADEQCVVTCQRRGHCCPTGCAPCTHAMHKDNLAQHQQWKAEHCANVVCPQAKCPAPTRELVGYCASHKRCGFKVLPLR